MRTYLEFDAPMSAMEAAQRAQYVLGKWKYRYWGVIGGVRFERAFSGSALVAVQPHHIHTTIDLGLEDLGDGRCRVTIDQRVMKLGQPATNLDKMVWRGDVDDLEAVLLRREEPRIDRIRQDRYAGLVSYKYFGFVILPALIATAAFLGLSNWVVGVASAVMLILSAVIMPYLPFKMPHFPLENQMPAPPFESNYMRGGGQR